MKEKNILLIGKSGSGKTTLANVLINKNNNFEEVFKESSKSISATKETQVGEFEHQEIKFRVIDTIGISDTKLTSREVLNVVAETCNELKGGLHQIFFVIQKRVTEEEWEVYNLLRSTIFDEEITKYTTIIRTSFTEFEDEESCEEDKRDLEQESEKLAELIRTCNSFIHIDNPPMKGRSATTNKETRKASRKKILEHLIYECGNYHPVNLDTLNERVQSYMTEKEKLEKKLEELSKKSEEEKKKAQEEIAELRAQIEVKAKGMDELEKQLRKKTCLIS
jgi:GTPase SAR1 family protein